MFSSVVWEKWKAYNSDRLIIHNTSNFPAQGDTSSGKSLVQISISFQVYLPVSILFHILFPILKTTNVTISYLVFLARTHLNIPNQFFSVN